MQHPRAGHRRTHVATDATPIRASGRTPPQIADHNLRVTLEAIRRDGPLTRLELARRSGLTAPGITNILRRLSSDGLITSGKRTVPGSGQPSAEFAIVPDGAFAVGVRLLRARSEAVLIDLSGRVRAQMMFEAGNDQGGAIAGVLDRFGRETPAAVRLFGVGIGAEMPETLDLRALRLAVAPVPVLVERDCVTAVLAERTFGVGVVDGGMMLIILDDSIRAGLLLQGVPFGGVHGRAGSIGSMRTGADHVPLDSVAGLGALRALLSEADRTTLSEGGELLPTPAIKGWIRLAAGHLLDAIVATAGFLAPGTILIGGDLPRSMIDALIAQMSVERGDTTIRPFATPWISPIRPASFAGGGIAIGAALLPFFDQLLPSPLAAA
jgi:predicted NBD/HSP70 family sugar kinase